MNGVPACLERSDLNATQGFGANAMTSEERRRRQFDGGADVDAAARVWTAASELRERLLHAVLALMVFMVPFPLTVSAMRREFALRRGWILIQ